MKTTQELSKTGEAVDLCPLLDVDYIEFYVGNAKQAAYFYQHAFGFQPICYCGPETGVRGKASYCLQQGRVRFVFTCALEPTSEIAAHVNMHGDGVRVVAFTVEDAKQAYEGTTQRGARGYLRPHQYQDEHGQVLVSGIHTYGDTVHLFIERQNYQGKFLPGYEPMESPLQVEEIGILEVDHIVGNVDWMQMNTWTKFYEETMGFRQLISFDDKDISTEYSALMSKVMANGNRRIKFPINEPALGKKKSQIEEYLNFYKGPGVQHIALLTDDIIHTVESLRKRGIEFLTVPDTYYETVTERCGEIDEKVESLRRLGILVDRDDEGYLLQIFTRPVEDRPTLFFEIIQRKGAQSFGKGNFKALFESLEREQARRGNL